MSEKNLLELYRELYRLTKKEAELLEEDKPAEEIMDLLGEKERLMEQIDEIDPKPFFQSREEPEEDFRKIKEIITECRELEEKNVNRLQKKKQKVKKDLGKLKAHTKTREKYLKQNMDAKFIDKRS
ncbi:MAG: hypothetical protein ACOCZM_03490 [Bacillota bacterium]